MIVVTVFLLIMNQTEDCLVHNQEESCRYDHIPFNWKGSDHLDTKYAQLAENKGGRKTSYHFISRLGATGVQNGCFRRPKIQFSSK